MKLEALKMDENLYDNRRQNPLTNYQNLKITMMNNKGAISEFIENYYLHFNAASLVDAAKAYERQLTNGSKMLVSLAGAMSTAEIGKIFAEMIRQEKCISFPVPGLIWKRIS